MFRLDKVRTVMRREYLSRVRTKAFWISTILVPAAMIAFAVLPSLIMSRQGGTFTVALLTPDEALAAEVEAELARRSEGPASAGLLNIRVEWIAPAPDSERQRAELRRRVLAKELTGVLVLPAGVLEGEPVEYLSTNVTAFRLIGRLDGAVERAVLRARLRLSAVPEERLDQLTRTVKLEPVRVTQEGGESREAVGSSFILSYALTFLIYITVMIYGFYVMRGVLEEKSSRIVEVIVANLSPTELMAGKIFGVGAVGLTQYLIWAVLAMNLAAPGLLSLGLAEGASRFLSPTLLIFFVLFFVFGYFLFATLYAAVGAAFNSEEEAQQMQTVLSMFLAIPFVLMFVILNDPDAPISVVLSLVPFFSPMLFFLRMTVAFPPTWQIVLCFALMSLSLLAMVRVSAAIYRVGILMYGKKPTWKEIARWVRSS
ncbi:MAG: ABC transporter permease [Acidobacteriota bacterium]|jgi:ABC-2 type transport system permease protein